MVTGKMRLWKDATRKVAASRKMRQTERCGLERCGCETDAAVERCDPESCGQQKDADKRKMRLHDLISMQDMIAQWQQL